MTLVRLSLYINIHTTVLECVLMIEVLVFAVTYKHSRKWCRCLKLPNGVIEERW